MAQYKIEHHGRYFEKKPQNAFNEYPQDLPGAGHRYYNRSYYVDRPFYFPKYIIHVAGEMIMRHPTLKRVGTRYLKCFITIPEREQDTFAMWGGGIGGNNGPIGFNQQRVVVETETILGWVIDQWLEPLNPDDTYNQEGSAKRKNLARFYLDRLRTTGKVKE